MPGPGSHLLYTLGSGLGFMHLSHGRFSVLHCLIYSVNALTGPDIGSVFEWAARQVAPATASRVMDVVHHPVGYILVLGAPLGTLYSWLSWRVAASASKGRALKEEGLRVQQTLCLVAAGCLSHFFLDILFEENGRDRFYLWILSTGTWEGAVPLSAATVLVVGALCCALIGGFYYLNRPRQAQLQPHLQKEAGTGGGGRAHWRTLLLLVAIGALYCLWCAVNLSEAFGSTRRPPVGEEADLGVMVFLGLFFFLPHGLCVLSMHPKMRAAEGPNELPLTLPLTRPGPRS
eukprot:jgi/Mesen1/4039/ME000213S03066